MSERFTELDVRARGVRISVHGDASEIAGHAYVYFLKNDLHDRPEAYLVDVFVEDGHRRRGIARKLVRRAIDVARREGAYKLVATSRYARAHVHALYLSEGFTDWGKEFRIEFPPPDP